MKVKELIEKLQQLDCNLEVDGLIDIVIYEETKYPYYFLENGCRVAKIHVSPAHIELVLD